MTIVVDWDVKPQKNKHKWAGARQNQQNDLCAQTDLSLCWVRIILFVLSYLGSNYIVYIKEEVLVHQRPDLLVTYSRFRVPQMSHQEKSQD